MVVPATVAVPVTATLQLVEPDTPPGGMVTVNVSVAPDREPDTVPVKATEPSGVFALAVPLTALPVWVSCQVTGPGPVESEPVPAYVPLMLVGAAGVDVNRRVVRPVVR